MYENIYGLSCVENQTLAILRNRGMDISRLYNNSAIPLKGIFYFAVIMGKKQEYFDRIPRIQETLKELGVITLVLKNQPNMQLVRNAIRSCKENQYILMKAAPTFTKDILLARGLRNDHYVLVKADSNNFAVLNDIPERTTILTARQLTKAYGGDYFKLTVKRELTKSDADFLWKNRIFKPENQIPFCFYERDLTDISNLAEKLRNMTGIYKTLRNRMAVYYNSYMDTEFIYDVLPAIEKCYSVFEYYNIKKNVTLDRYFSLLYKLNETETDIMLKLKDELATNNK